ncbi:MAG: hypothetical protein J5958_06730 [Clostridia bacterium]|nr:hypothetical protein [Clostridia bacterium]
MKGFKAFKKGLICRDKQYAENTVFEEDEAVICEKGMHFCKEPLDVLEHYPLVDENEELTEFAEVEALDDPVTDDGKKFCTKRLKIGAKIDFPHLVQASVSFDYEKETPIKTTKKNNAQIGSSGDWAQIGSSGDWAKIGSSGDWAKIGSSGDGAKIGSSGDWAQIGSSGKNAVIMCAGINSIAKGKIGSWITLSEWKNVDGVYTPVCVKTEKIDGERIKEDTFYKLKNGEFVEV